MLYNAGPVDVSWAVNSDKVVAILESFFPAQVKLHVGMSGYETVTKFLSFYQTGGSALVDVLTGAVSPAGRLPSTWPASLDQVGIIVIDIPISFGLNIICW